MKVPAVFTIGFVSGWLARSTVDSSRSVAVSAVAAAFAVADRVRRIAAIEREHLEDLVAEGRAKFEATRAAAYAKKQRRADAAAEAKRDAPSSPRATSIATGRAA